MRIAVIGAGIGGLAAAAALSADRHDVVVYERRDDAGAVGSGLTLFSNSFAALDEVGLGERIRIVCSDAIAMVRSGQRTPSGDWLADIAPETLLGLRSVNRGDLHAALAGTLPPSSFRLSQNAAVAASGEPTVSVADRPERFDLVVAADGLRSESRARLNLDRGVRYAGYTVWRGITSIGVDVHGAAGETWGNGKLFGIVPLSGERVYWFGTESTAAGQHNEDEHQAARDRFGTWHSPILECINATPTDAVLRHDIYDLAHLPSSFVKGRTVLLGDAAHAMTPNLGQGAGQAIEDAVTLALTLRESSNIGIDAALARYSMVRRNRTKKIWLQSRIMGTLTRITNPTGVSVRNALLRATPSALTARAIRNVQRWSAPS